MSIQLNETPAFDEMFEAPIWELASEYSLPDSTEVQDELDQIERNLEAIKSLNPYIEAVLEKKISFDVAQPLLETAWKITQLEEESVILLMNLFLYAKLHLSVDSRDQSNKVLFAKLEVKLSEFKQMVEPLRLFVLRADEESIQAYLAHDTTRDYQFITHYQRQQTPFLLSLLEENLLTGFQRDGHNAWGNLYENLSSSLQAEVEDLSGQIAIKSASQLFSLLGDEENDIRRNAYRGRAKAYEAHQETCSSILNALAGWRLEVCQKRSHTQTTGFLDNAYQDNRLTSQTLKTMMQVVEEELELGREACQIMATVMKKDKMDPWDTEAPAPQLFGGSPTKMPFKEGIDLIVEAFNEVHPEMADFVKMMVSNQWIDAREASHKTPGAFCATFQKSRTPRVLMTYMGSTRDVIILAHELGHAYHFWEMRHLPYAQTHLPMTLAETASTFAEQTVRDFMFSQSDSKQDKLDIIWQELSAAAFFLVNIPARFTFEKNFYEQRSQKIFTPDDFKALMTREWNHWYGETMSEANELFWMTKPHFYSTYASFYNFPYIVGYLLSQGIYNQKEKLGNEFFSFYREMLLDTGRMTVEDLVQKHFGLDTTSKDFWLGCYKNIRKQVHHFEALGI